MKLSMNTYLSFEVVASSLVWQTECVGDPGSFRDSNIYMNSLIKSIPVVY